MNLKAKASKIDFGALMSTPSNASEARAPKTAPGAMMAHANDARSELLRENEELRGRVARTTDLEAQLAEVVDDLRAWDGAKPVRLLAPERIRRSHYANRHESSFLGEDFEQLKREIADAGGNVQAIKVRPVKAADGVEFEIVFGHRRHEACRQLGLPVLAVVDNLDDRTLFVEMDRENRDRADLSPWEQGVMYMRALDGGLFPSNRQLATALGIDPSNLGKSLALARLPGELVAAFASPLDIQLRWAPLLNKALEQDRDGLLKRAGEMATHRGARGPKAVFSFLVEPPVVNLPLTAKEPRIFSVGGKKVATLRFDPVGRASLHIHIPLSAAQQQALADATEALVTAL